MALLVSPLAAFFSGCLLIFFPLLSLPFLCPSQLGVPRVLPCAGGVTRVGFALQGDAAGGQGPGEAEGTAGRWQGQRYPTA